MAETSYPFLRIARQFGVPYGQVLAYRDAVIKTAGLSFAQLDCWEREAWSALCGSVAAVAIIDAIKRESGRRAGLDISRGGDRA